MFYKLTSTAVLLTLSMGAFAGSMGDVSTSKYSIGAHALYLQPSLGEYSTPGNLLLTSSTTNSARYQLRNYDPKWNWGFQVEGSYHSNADNDISLNWYHIVNTSHYAYRDTLIPAAGNISGFGTTSLSPTWNAANFEVGHRILFHGNTSARVHGGVQYARLTVNKNVYQTVDVGAPRTVTETGSYNGFGPRIGTDLSYQWIHGLGVYANGAASLLIGNKGYSRTTQLSSFETSFNGSSTAIVPEFDMKLGANYNHDLAQGTLTLDAGWMWVTYLHSNTYIRPLSLTIRDTKENNFSLQGLYLGLKWSGNIA